METCENKVIRANADARNAIAPMHAAWRHASKAADTGLWRLWVARLYASHVFYGVERRCEAPRPVLSDVETPRGIQFDVSLDGKRSGEASLHARYSAERPWEIQLHVF